MRSFAILMALVFAVLLITQCCAQVNQNQPASNPQYGVTVPNATVPNVAVPKVNVPYGTNIPQQPQGVYQPGTNQGIGVAGQGAGAASQSWSCPPTGQSWSCPPSGTAMGQSQYQQSGASMGMGSMMGTGTIAGMGAGPSSGMMMPFGMAANDTAVFILRGNEVIKLSADDLHVISSQTLPAASTASASMSSGAITGAGPFGQADIGAGPSYTPSSSEIGTPRSTAQQFLNSLNSMSANQMEQSLMQAVIQNHVGAIAWSKLAANRATHLELQRFARNIANDESKINTRFAGLLRNWYGVKANTTMTSADNEELSRLKSLSKSAFEMAYMRAMLTHFSEAAALSNIAAQKATHPELKTIATSMLKTHAQQVQQLRTWLSKWYNMSM